MLKNRNYQRIAYKGKALAVVAAASTTLVFSSTAGFASTLNETEQIYEAVNQETDGILDTTDIFTERDLTQTVDTADAALVTVTDGEDVHITEEGIYVISGTASDVTIYVEAEDTAKVQLVLDGVSITNTDKPCIYVTSADKVFVTTSADSSLTVSDEFAADEENADAVIFSKDDLVLNGTAALTVSSSDTGISGKDDLKITGGSYVITAQKKAIEANDSICVANGTFTLQAGTDGLHAESGTESEEGYIYIADGTFTIEAGDDGIHGTSAIQIDGGTFTIEAVEAIEATYVQINGGSIDISASDDGINASQKSTAYDVTIEITGGDINIEMGGGDTDALDANGDLIISGGNINITAQSAFDYDNSGTFTGGTITVNGEEVTELTQSMMGPGGGMNRGGGMGRGGMGRGGMKFGGNTEEGTAPTLPEGMSEDEMEDMRPGDGQMPEDMPENMMPKDGADMKNENSEEGDSETEEESSESDDVNIGLEA